MKNYKFVMAMIVMGTIIAGGLFAQEKYDGSKKNSILATAGLLAGGIHYERSLNTTWTVGAEFEYDWVFFLWGDYTANVFARWYPTKKAMFVELGLGYASAFSPDTYEGENGFTYAGISTVNGADIRAKFGWKIDIGKPGGFVIEPAAHVGVVLGAKTWDGWASSVDPEFGAKVFFNPTFSLGWTF